MKLLLQEIRRNPLLWLLVFVPVALAADKLNHEAHTLHFILSVLAILPLAVLLSHATESVAAKTGDSVATALPFAACRKQVNGVAGIQYQPMKML
jgi:Ca2+:H+ antiporter